MLVSRQHKTTPNIVTYLELRGQSYDSATYLAFLHNPHVLLNVLSATNPLKNRPNCPFQAFFSGFCTQIWRKYLFELFWIESVSLCTFILSRVFSSLGISCGSSLMSFQNLRFVHLGSVTTEIGIDFIPRWLSLCKLR